VAVLRQGFLQLLKDAEFAQEFKKVTRSELRCQGGGEADKLIQKLIQAPPKVKSTVRKYTESK
jgi:hypothetical protein